MGVDLSRGQRSVAKHLLHAAQVGTTFQQMGRHRVPKPVLGGMAMLKRLGGRRWTQLHRSVYAIAIIGVIHYWWLVKKDITLPLLYAVLLGALLGFRALRLARERQRQLRAAIYENG